MEHWAYVFNHAKPFEELPEKVTGEIFWAKEVVNNTHTHTQRHTHTYTIIIVSLKKTHRILIHPTE